MFFQLPFDPIGQDEKVSLFGPYEFRIGLLLYYSVPCTITAGIVLVAQAEGNLPMAGAVATVANVIGCYTTPILLKLFLANGQSAFYVIYISSRSLFIYILLFNVSFITTYH